jgi:membrane protein YqaA with SNARE-associated domain
MASLLSGWVPAIGDALTVIAGTLRVPLMPFTLVVGIGKLFRYLVVGAGARALSNGGS